MPPGAENYFPDSPPVFEDSLVKRCQESRDYRPILFEWYKHVGKLCNRAACLEPDSPAFRGLPPVYYAVLVGLLNRCSRLMVANVRLSCTKRYGETTLLLDRSIAETAIKVLWLCKQGDDESFVRYLADGLKNDLKLKSQILQNVESRGGQKLVIEERMLRSIERCIQWSGLNESLVENAKKLPDLASMYRTLGLDESFYTGLQRMGSHAVHGTWSDLVFHYLTVQDGRGFRPRDHDVDTEDAQFIIVCRLVLSAMSSFLHYAAADPSELKEVISVFDQVREKLIEIQDMAWHDAFQKQ